MTGRDEHWGGGGRGSLGSDRQSGTGRGGHREGREGD